MSALQLKPAAAAPPSISACVVSPCRPLSALSLGRHDALATVAAPAANAGKSVSIAAATHVAFDFVIVAPRFGNLPTRLCRVAVGGSRREIGRAACRERV